MGRWAQARKRGSTPGPVSVLLSPPAYGEDWTSQYLSETDQGEVSEPDEPLDPPKVGIRLQRSANSGPWLEWELLTPGDSVVWDDLSLYESLRVRARWSGEGDAVLSDWSDPFDLTSQVG